jgi:hypothetical protein
MIILKNQANRCAYKKTHFCNRFLRVSGWARYTDDVTVLPKASRSCEQKRKAVHCLPFYVLCKGRLRLAGESCRTKPNRETQLFSSGEGLHQGGGLHVAGFKNRISLQENFVNTCQPRYRHATRHQADAHRRSGGRSGPESAPFSPGRVLRGGRSANLL